MPRYDGETKAKALQMLKELGAQKTHDELKISTQTLYKWQREANTASEKIDSLEIQRIKQLLEEQESLALQLEQAHNENARLAQALAETNSKRGQDSAEYKKKIRRLNKLVVALLQEE